MQAPNLTSGPLNCVGSNSEDYSDAEFVPCPNTTFPSAYNPQKTLDSRTAALTGSNAPTISQPDDNNDNIILIDDDNDDNIILVVDPESIFEAPETKLSCSRKEGYQINTNIFSTVMNFAYIIETSTSEIDLSIISNLEKAILKSLDESILDCSSLFLENGSSRKLQSKDKSSNGLVSVDSNPSDEISDEVCSPQHENAQACYVIEGRMALYFTSDDVNMIMDAKQELLKSILISMAEGEFLSDDMPFLLRVGYLRPYITEEIRKPQSSDPNEDAGKMNLVIITTSSTFFVAVFAFVVRRKVLSRQSAEINGSNHDQSIHDDSIHVESEQV
eukprot:CAMPEP_0194346684 /NCGR_PEP_ID=MMETSP0171-20130528/105568_1 /TAXON_ID=218684 /ORGANISM="Corethron pennatum, Strain L29A3" /LENGTH=330 /DNA_ID=CAMNT_0039113845 /DNA_START=118 /DNA_END=1110 /DNA_ORIENTATION=+